MSIRQEVTGNRSKSAVPVSSRWRPSSWAVRCARPGELLLAGRLDVDHGQLTVIDPRPPDDLLARTVLDSVINTPAVTAVRDWLLYLSRDAYIKVAQRLRRGGHVQVRRVRRFLRSTLVYFPVNLNSAARPAARLATRLRQREPLTTSDIVLTGLLAATGLDRVVLADAPAWIAQHTRNLLAEIPTPLRELVAATQTAVEEAAPETLG